MIPHVVHLVASFDTGGLQNGIVNLMNHSDPSDVRHTVLSFSDQMDLADRLQVGEATTLGLAPGPHRRAWREVAERLRDLNADVLHTRNFATWPDGIRAASRAGVRHRVHGFHGRDLAGIDGLPMKRRLLGRLLAASTSVFITLTPSMREEFSKEFFISPDRVRVIPNGFDKALFTASKGEKPLQSPFTVATVGRFAPVKNLSLLIRAFGSMENRGQDDLLVLAGDGPERAQLQGLVEDLGLSHSVRFTGMLSEIAPLYAAADVYVQPSFYEGMSNTIVEAMACEVPVIATDVGGNADVLGSEGAGCLVPSNDVTAMARALDAWRNDEEDRKRAGICGQERVRELFGMSRMVESYVGVYKSLVGS